MELSLLDNPAVEIVKVERLDHLGIIASVITDLGIKELIDTRIVGDDQEEISSGEAVASMIINGLGFSNRPLSLTPQFFSNKPLELLFREDVCAEHFNRFKLGRSLDKVFDYGCDLLSAKSHFLFASKKGLIYVSIALTPAVFPSLASISLRVTNRLSC
jgi:transposase